MLASQACFPGDRHASVDYVFASKTERYASGAWHLVAVLSGEMLARQACFPGDRHASVVYVFASKTERYASGAWHLVAVLSGGMLARQSVLPWGQTRVGRLRIC